MGLLFTSKTIREPGPIVHIHCTACGRQDTEAKTYQQVEKMGVFFIPLLTQRETHIECCDCGVDRITNLRIDELVGRDADNLSIHLRKRTSMILAFFAIASLVLCWVPFVGFGLGLIGYVSNYWNGGWPKKLSLISMGLSAVITVLLLIFVR